jgi:hypothetical protein
MSGKDDVADAFGMDRHSASTNSDGGTHHTVSNDVTRISWDEDRDGNFKDGSYHERRAPGTSGGGIRGGRKK